VKNVVDTVISDNQLTMLTTIVRETGLVETLSSDGPFTIFAPTDEAFAKLSQKTIDYLMSDKERLTEILTYHVIHGKIKSDEVLKLKKAITVQGSSLIFQNDSPVKVNKASVLLADIECENGMIHVINEVLIPK